MRPSPSRVEVAPADEVARLAALQRYRGLVTNDERDFDLLVSVAAELTGCPRACITFVDRERVWSKAVVGMPHFELPRAHDYCGLTIAEVHGLDIPDLLADPRTREMPATRGDRAHRMYSGVNLVTPDGHRIGTLCVLDTRPRQLPARQRELLERLAAQVMALLELRRVERELRGAQAELTRLATVDPLTGLLNRRAWEAALAHELQRQARFGGRWALLLIDLDHFKRINDRHGHPAGDAVLRAVAALLTARLREVDIVARLGGEEFALLLPRTDAAGARTVAEALRRAIAGLSLPWGGAQLSLTASAGLVLSDEAPGLTADAAYALADRRLYAAKQAGRNRVVADDAEAQPRPSLRQISSVNAD